MKASSPRVGAVVASDVTFESSPHSWKAPLSISVKSLPKTSSVKEAQSLKALPPIEVTPSGMLIVPVKLQPEKAATPMEVTLLGM